jgi:hypothetical protein
MTTMANCHVRRFSFVALCAVALAASACSSRKVDLPKALEVIEVTTGYFDAGIVEGNKNKLVPSISVRLKNIDTDSISSVQMIAKFNQLGDPMELGSAPFIRAIGPEGLAPGKTTGPLVMRGDVGYTGEQSRAEMLAHKEFKDIQVELFAKYGAEQFVKMGQYRVARQLLTH